MRKPMKLKRYLTLLLFGLVCLIHQSGHASAQQWVRRVRLDTGTTDWGLATTTDSAGNVYVTGRSNHMGKYDDDIFTVKYSPTGKKLWQHRYDGPNHLMDQPSGIAVDTSGNCYVIGYADDGSRTIGVKSVLIKYDTTGKQAWARLIDGRYLGGNRATPQLAVSASGNIYVTGARKIFGDARQILVMKYDPKGKLKWANVYGGTEQAGLCIALDSNENAYIAAGAVGMVTLKVDADGKLLWLSHYKGPTEKYDYPAGIGLDSAGNAYVVATSYGGDDKKYDIATIKYDANGNEAWVKRFDGENHFDDFAGSAYNLYRLSTSSAIAVAADGNAYVTGLTTLDRLGNTNLLLIKYDTYGTQKWIRTYDGPDKKGAGGTAIVMDSANNLYVTGACYPGLLTLKYNSSGGLLWEHDYHGTEKNGKNIGLALAVDALESVFVTGFSYGGRVEYDDMILLKYTK